MLLLSLRAASSCHCEEARRSKKTSPSIADSDLALLPSKDDRGLTLLPSKRLAGKSVQGCKSLRGAIASSYLLAMTRAVAICWSRGGLLRRVCGFGNSLSKWVCVCSLSLPRRRRNKLVLLYFLSAASPRKDVAFDFRSRFDVVAFEG